MLCLSVKKTRTIQDSSRETESFSLQKKTECKTSLLAGAHDWRCSLSCAHTPLWVPSTPLVGLLLPYMGPFATLCGLFSGSSRGWFTNYVNRLLSLLCFFVCVYAEVSGGLSPDLYGFVPVYAEIFSSWGCLVGSGFESSSHLELFLTIPLAIWG